MSSLNVQDVVSKLKTCLPNEKFIALHEPTFKGKEWGYVKDCLDTGWVSSVGKYVDEFEARLAEFTGVRHAVAVVNGTAALHVSLLIAGVERGDEVLIPALSFVATANAVAYCGAIPHFVDSEERTLGLDPSKLSDYMSAIAEIRSGQCYNKKTGRRMKAVIPMHTFGHPVELDSLVDLCERYHLILIEDAAESLGSYYKGRHTGNWGALSALSFNGNKIITTGGGGAILTNDAELAKRAKHLTTTAKVPHQWEFIHDQTGYNYRMPNLNAALGCAQLEGLPNFIRIKRTLAHKYQETFNGMSGIRCFTEMEDAQSNYWLNVLLLDEANAGQRDTLLELTNIEGIMTRPAWNLLNELDMYKDCPKMDLSVAESLSRRIINIPSSVKLGDSIAQS
ncbi:MAG: LegC family aminotransferase [Paenibacillaceae bacterium]